MNETVMLCVAVGVLAILLVALILLLSKSSKDAPEPAPSVGKQASAPVFASTPKDLYEHFGRPGFLPEVEPGDAGRSHFCGRPWLAQGEAWPTCGHCKEPMQLFLQLDLDVLPNGAPAQRSGGLAQVFYCVNSKRECEVELEAWDAFSAGALARVVDPTQPGAQAEEDLASSAYPAQTIVGWQSVDDIPSAEEVRYLDVLLAPEVGDYYEEAEVPYAGDKLGGWAKWIQGVEYPRCPQCQELMELVFQIDSQDHVPYMFGDVGTAHLTRCKTHSTILAFGWACG